MLCSLFCSSHLLLLSLKVQGRIVVPCYFVYIARQEQQGTRKAASNFGAWWFTRSTAVGRVESASLSLCAEIYKLAFPCAASGTRIDVYPVCAGDLRSPVTCGAFVDRDLRSPAHTGYTLIQVPEAVAGCKSRGLPSHTSAHE